MSRCGKYVLSKDDENLENSDRIRNYLYYSFMNMHHLIMMQEFLNNESGRKTLSKLQRPETGRASAWELMLNLEIKKILVCFEINEGLKSGR